MDSAVAPREVFDHSEGRPGRAGNGIALGDDLDEGAAQPFGIGLGEGARDRNENKAGGKAGQKPANGTEGEPDFQGLGTAGEFGQGRLTAGRSRGRSPLSRPSR